MQQKKAVLINDLSGLGRCSLAVELPVLSVMQVECLLLPVALLSNHTGYSSFVMRDLSEDLDPWMEEWRKQNVQCDAILSGFLGSAGQVRHVLHFLDLFAAPGVLVVVDPVLGDQGKLYPTCTNELVQAMKKLCSRASVILPNVTEACLLSDTPWKEEFSQSELERMARKLLGLGPGKVVISGIENKDSVLDCICSEDGTCSWICSKKQAAMRAGTGDLFAAVITGSLLQGKSLSEAVEKAGSFVRRALKVTEALQVPPEEGCAFEMVLQDLIPACQPAKDN